MPEKNESHETSGRGRGLGFVAALVVGLPLLYLLSTGPVLLLMDKTNRFGGAVPSDWVINFYWPIVWLYLNTAMKHQIEWYLSLWGVS